MLRLPQAGDVQRVALSYADILEGAALLTKDEVG